MLAADTQGDDRWTAQQVSLTPGIPVTIDATIGDGYYGNADVDIFQVNLQSGQLFEADLDAASGSSLDSYLQLFDGYGYPVASNNDDPANPPDSLISYSVTSTGMYFLGLTSAGNTYYYLDYAGSGQAGTTTGDYHLELVIDPPAGDPAVAVADTYSTVEGQTLQVSAPGLLSNDTIPSGGTYTAAVHAHPLSGGLDSFGTDGSFEYTPDPGFFGTDTFEYLVQGPVDSNVVTVTINVDPSPNINHIPSVTDDALDVSTDRKLVVSQPGVLLNDGDIDGDSISAMVVDEPQNGRLTYFGAHGSLEYVPDPGFVGSDSFTYRVTDGELTSGLATVNLTVSAPGSVSIVEIEKPVARGERYQVDRDTTFTSPLGGFLTNDLNATLGTISSDVLTWPRFGQLTLQSNGKFTYTPFPGFVGQDSFRYQVTNDVGQSAPATVTLDVIEPAVVLDPANKPGHISVTTLLDEVASNGLTSLREAVQLAAANGPGLDIIEFDIADGPVRLLDSLGPIVVDSDVIIRGSDDVLRVVEPDASQQTRLFQIQAGATVTLENLEVSGGYLSSGDGGGIWNAGALTLERVFVSSNNAAGGRGGGIYNAAGATLDVIQSTIANNSSYSDGGGVFNAAGGSVTLDTTTISSNTAGIWGGGLYNSGTADIFASTLVENQANTGSNLAAVGSVDLADTIVAEGIYSDDIDGTVTSAGGNLVGSYSGMGSFHASDQVGDYYYPIDPLIGDLQLNGGLTPTHMLLTGSPAIDAGVAVHRSLDQRGADRVLDGLDPNALADANKQVDIGAVEFGTFFVNTLDDAVDTTPLGDGRVDVDATTPGDQVSLRAAIEEANALSGFGNNAGLGSGQLDSVIQFSYHENHTLVLDQRGIGEDASATGDLDIHGNLTIRGQKSSSDLLMTHIDGGWFWGIQAINYQEADLQDRLFEVHPGASLELATIQLAGGQSDIAGGYGGAILNRSGTLLLEEASVSSSTSQRGAGLASLGGLTYVSGDSVVSGNAGAVGGGIYVEGGSVSVDDSSVQSNITTIGGSGIFVEDGELLVGGGAVIKNNVHNQRDFDDGQGSAIYLAGGSATVRDGAVILDNGLSEDNVNYESQRLTDNDLLPPARYILTDGSLYSANASVFVTEAAEFHLIEATIRNTSANLPSSPGGLPVIPIINLGKTSAVDSTFEDNDLLIANFWTGDATIQGGVVRRTGGHYEYGGRDAFDTTFRYATSGLIDSPIQNLNGRMSLIDLTIEGGDLNVGADFVSNFGSESQLDVIGAHFQNASLGNTDGEVNLLNSVFVDGDYGWYQGDFPMSAVFNSSHGTKISAATQVANMTLALPLSATDSVAYVNDAAPLSRFSLPLEVVLNEERMIVTDIDHNAETLTLSRPHAQSHASGDTVIIRNEFADQIAVEDVSSFVGYDLPLSIYLDLSGGSRQWSRRDIEGTSGNSQVEALTVTDIDFENGVLHVLRGRSGTAPARFNQAGTNPTIWSVPGQMTISGTTFANQSVSADQLDSSVSVVRSMSAELAPPLVIENSTFSGARSTGPVATVFAERNSLTGTVETFHAQNHEVILIDGGRETFTVEPISQSVPPLIVENSVFAGSTDYVTGEAIADATQLPPAQRHFNFVVGLTDDTSNVHYGDSVVPDPPPGGPTFPPPEPTESTEPDPTAPSGIDPKHRPKRITLDGGSGSSFGASAVALHDGYLGDGWVVPYDDSVSSQPVARWSYRGIAPGTYSVATVYHEELTGPIAFRVNDVDGEFQVDTALVGNIGPSDNSITVQSLPVHVGEHLRIGQEEMLVQSVSDNGDGTQAVGVLRGRQGTTAQSHADQQRVLRSDYLFFDELSGRQWVHLMEDYEFSGGGASSDGQGTITVELWAAGESSVLAADAVHIREKIFVAPGENAASVVLTHDDLGEIPHGAAIDFGTTRVGQTLTQTVNVHNDGDTVLTFHSISAPAGFTVTSPASGSFSVGPGGTIDVTLQLDATTEGLAHGVVTIDLEGHEDLAFIVSGATILENAIQIIDDGDTAFSESEFNGSISAGFGDDATLGYTTDPLGNATWQFATPPGTYRVAATWPGVTGLSAQTPVVVSDAASTQLLSTQLDQTLKPSEFVSDGSWWTQVGEVTTSGVNSDISVKMTNDAGDGGASAADAILVQRLADVTVSLSGGGAIGHDEHVGFGVTELGTAKSKTFTVQNDSQGTYRLRPIVPPGGFRVINNFTLGQQLAAGQSASFTLELAAEREMKAHGWVSVVLDDMDDTNGVADRLSRFQVSGTTLQSDLGVQIVDSSDPGTFRIGDFTGVDDGYRAKQWTASDASTSNRATWIVDVLPGTYEVSATWAALDGNASSASFTVRDGLAGAPSAAVNVNQQNIPSTYTLDHVAWESLGSFTVNSDTLVVELSGSSANWVADAIRIQRVAEISVTDESSNPVPEFSHVGMGVVEVGAFAEKTFALTNDASTSLTLESLSVPAQFQIIEGITQGQTLLSGQSTDIRLRMNSGIANTAGGIVSIVVSGGASESSTYDFTISGTVVDSIDDHLTVDNLDYGFDFVGRFVQESLVRDTGYHDSMLQLDAASASVEKSEAIWRFDVEPGREYEVAMTWGLGGNASDASFSFHPSADGPAIQTTTVDQSLSSDQTAGSESGWVVVDTLTAPGNSLVVKLANDPALGGTVAADAIRLRPTGTSAHTHLHAQQRSSDFFSMPTCQSAGELLATTVTSDFVRFELASVPPGTYRLLTSFDGLDDGRIVIDSQTGNPVEISSPLARHALYDEIAMHDWYDLSELEITTEVVTVEIHIPDGAQGVTPAICLTTPEALMEIENSASVTSSGLVTSQTRSIVDNSYAAYQTTGTVTTARSPYSYGGEYDEIPAGVTATFSFEDLVPGTYLVASALDPSLTTNLPFEIEESGTVLSAGELQFTSVNQNLLRSYTQRQYGGFVTGQTENFGNTAFYEDGLRQDSVSGLVDARQDWIVLDRVEVTGSELQVQIAGGTGVFADAIRIERFRSVDPMLARPADLGGFAAGQSPDVQSDLIDHGHDALLKGIHAELSSSISDQFGDGWLYLDDVTPFVRSEHNLLAPAFPFPISVGRETMLALGYDDSQDALIVERGQPLAHPTGTNVLYGFAGQSTLLAQRVMDAGATSIRVDAISGLPASKQFDIRVADEEMTVTGVQDNGDGTLDLEVVRGIRGTTALSEIPVNTHVLILTDQSGGNRFYDSNGNGSTRMDFGAVEAVHIDVDTQLDLVDLLPGDGKVTTTVTGATSLRAAINEANAIGGSATITLPAGQYGISLVGESEDEFGKDLDIYSHVLIQGAGADVTTISAAQLDRVFEVHPGATLALQGVRVIGGVTSGDGGAVLVRGGTLLTDSAHFEGNQAARGGGVFVTGDGKAHLFRSTISGSTATAEGGAIYLESGQLETRDVTLSGNQAATGAAVYTAAGSVAAIASSTITENSATDVGGVHAVGEVTLSETVVAGNTATAATDSPDVSGVLVSAGHNFIGITQTRTTAVYSYDHNATTGRFDVNVTDASMLPVAPFTILVDGNTMPVYRVSGNTLHIGTGEDDQPSFQALADNTEIRLDGLWNASDWTGSLNSPLDPMLSPLVTTLSTMPVHEPLPGSPLIDVGAQPDGPIHPTDQRGRPRYHDHDLDSRMERDIGAVEREEWIEIQSLTAAQVETATGESQTFDFLVTRSHSDVAVTVQYTVSGSGKHRADNTDFPGDAFPGGELAFAVGESQKTVSITIDGDNVVEADEQFTVRIEHVSPMTVINQREAHGIILNDDDARIVVSNHTIIEGDPDSPYTYVNIDHDKDGIINSIEGDDSVDTDGDSIPDYLDVDSDNDGVPDRVEAWDNDRDGIPTYVPSGMDSDADGLDDAFDLSPSDLTDPVSGRTPTADFDGDGILDHLDSDSDNNGVPDLIQVWDTNGDGVAETVPLGSDTDGDGWDEAFDSDGINPWENLYQQLTFDVTLDNDVEGGFSIGYGVEFGTDEAANALRVLDASAVDGTFNFSGYSGETFSVGVQVVREEMVELNESFRVDFDRYASGTTRVQKRAIHAEPGLGTIVNDDVFGIMMDNIQTHGSGSNQYTTVDLALTEDVDQPVWATVNVGSEQERVMFLGKRGELLSVTVDDVGSVTLSDIYAYGREIAYDPNHTLAGAFTSGSTGGGDPDGGFDFDGDSILDQLVFTERNSVIPTSMLSETTCTSWGYHLDGGNGDWYKHDSLSGDYYKFPIKDADLISLFEGSIYDVGAILSIIDSQVAASEDYESSDPFWQSVVAFAEQWPDSPTGNTPYYSSVHSCQGLPETLPNDPPIDPDDHPDPEIPGELPPGVPATPELGWTTHEDQRFPGSESHQTSHVVPDYQVSHRSSLQFNPIASYEIPDDMTLTSAPNISLVIADSPLSGGDPATHYTDGSLTGSLGIVSIESDFSLRYSPLPGIASELSPRKNADEAVYQYDATETFYVAVKIDDAGTARYIDEVPVSVMVTDSLPVLLGDRMHTPGEDAIMHLDAPIYVDFESTMRLDVNDLFFDPDNAFTDGAQPEDRIEVETISFDNSSARQSEDGTLSFRSGNIQRMQYNDVQPTFTTGIFTDIPGFANQQPATVWTTAEEKRLFVKLVDASEYGDQQPDPLLSREGTIIDIYNELTPADVNSSIPSRMRWSPESQSITIDLVVTDGSRHEQYTDNGQTVTGDPVARVVRVNIVPRGNDEDGWIEAKAQPTRAFEQIVSPGLPDRDQATADTTWGIDAVYAGENRGFQSVGGTAVDMVTGTFLVDHSLILDGSGGTSELALPGLVYDSSTVHVAGKQTPIIQAELTPPSGAAPASFTAKLTWYDHTVSERTPDEPFGAEYTTEETFSLDWTGGSNVIALAASHAPTRTGLYSWKLELDFGDGTVITNHGQSPVVVNQGDSAAFGDGWALAGEPTLALDRYDGGNAHASPWNANGFDDRLILSFPGSEPVLFDYSDLTVAELSLPRQLPSIQPGSKSTGQQGFHDVQEYGTLTARHDPFGYTHPEASDPDTPDELVYKAPGGMEYVFYRWDIGGNVEYLLNRIEQPGIDFDPSVILPANSTDRRGVSMQRDSSGRLTAIVAADGTQTNLTYTGDHVTQLVTATNSSRTVDLSFVGNELDTITHQNAAPSLVPTANVFNRVRKFTYDSGLMTSDQLLADTTVQRERAFLYSLQQLPGESAPPPSYRTTGLTAIRVGDAAPSATENQVTHYIHAGVLSGIVPTQSERDARSLEPLTAAAMTGVQDLKRLNVSEMPELVASTDLQDKTLYEHGLENRVSRFRHEFSGTGLSEVLYARDAVGSVVATLETDLATANTWNRTTYRYDYQVPAGGAGDWQYDEDDYRGNVIYVTTPTQTQKLQYETDDAMLDAVGQLVTSTIVSKAGGQMVTTYQRQTDGRLLEMRVDRDTAADNPAAANVAGGDHVQVWTYYGGDGHLEKTVDARGLETTYVTYENGRVKRTSALEDVYNDGFIGDYGYDAWGFLADVTQTAYGHVTSITRTAIDALGDLRRSTVESGSGEILSQQSYEYDAAGAIVASVVPVHNVSLAGDEDMRSTWTYDKAGFLVSETIAENASFDVYYTGNSDSVAQTTEYAYYGNGLLKSVTHPGENTTDHYYDPLARKQWTVQDQIAGVNGTLDKKDILETAFQANGTVLESSSSLMSVVTSPGVPGLTSDLSQSAPNTKAGSILDVSETFRSDSFGRTTFSRTATGHLATAKYDTLGLPTESVDHGYGGKVYEVLTNAAGDVLEETEHRYTPGQTGSTSYTTKYEYDELGRLRRIEDPLAAIESGTQVATVSYDYDTTRDATRVTTTSRLGIATHQWHDAAGRLIRAENERGAVTEYDYDKSGRLLLEKSTPAEADLPITTAEHQYDPLGRIRKTITKIASKTTSDVLETFQATDYFEFDSPDGDGWNVIQFVTLPGDGSSVVGDHKYHATRTKLDAAGNPVLVQLPDPADTIAASTDDVPTTVYSYTYGTGTRTVETTLMPAANYDGTIAVSAISSTDPSQDRTSKQKFRFDGALLESSVWDVRVDANGNDLTAAYHVLVSYVYDSATGRLTQSLDAENKATNYSYDPLTGLVSQVIKPNGETVDYEYDSSGNRTRLNYTGNPAGGTGDTFWQYDALGRVTEESIAALPGQLRTWTYAGLTSTYNDRNGVNHVTTFDPLTGDTSSIANDVTGGVTFERTETVNSVGALSGVTEWLKRNSDGSKLYESDFSFDADASDRVIENSYALAFGSDQLDQVTTSNLDNRGVLESRVFSFQGGKATGGDLWTDYTDFDWLGRQTAWERDFVDISSLAADVAGIWGAATDEPDGKLIDYGYNADGSRASVSRTQIDDVGAYLKATTTQTYTPGGSLKEIEHESDQSGLLARHKYGYDSRGRLSHQSDLYADGTVGGSVYRSASRVFSYDDAGQLTSSVETIDAQTPVTRTYTNGQSSTSGTWTVGGDNRLTQDDQYSYQYDDEGRMTRRTSLADPDQRDEFKWDPAGRLIEVKRYDTNGTLEKTVEYGYDANGLMIGRRELDGASNVISETAHLRDGLQVLAELDLSGVDPTITTLYSHGNAPNEIVAVDVPDSTGEFESVWAFTDLLGSVSTVASEDSGGWDVVHTVTTEYGGNQAKLGSSAAHLQDVDVWAGHHVDEATGLIESKARWFDPDNGRFISQDPMGFAAGDENLYRYVGNGPGNSTDPDGRQGRPHQRRNRAHRTQSTSSAMAEAFVGSILEDTVGTIPAIVDAPRAIISGDAGRALGERAVRIVERTGDGSFNGGFGDYFHFSVVVAGDLTGGTALVQAFYENDFETGQHLTLSDRISGAGYATAGFASMALGGVAAGARIAPNRFAKLAETGKLTNRVSQTYRSVLANPRTKVGKVADVADNRRLPVIQNACFVAGTPFMKPDGTVEDVTDSRASAAISVVAIGVTGMVVAQHLQRRKRDKWLQEQKQHQIDDCFARLSQDDSI